MSPQPSTPARIGSARIGAGPIWGALYLALALALVALGAFMHVQRGAPLLGVQVTGPGVVSIWFFLRAALAFRARGK